MQGREKKREDELREFRTSNEWIIIIQYNAIQCNIVRTCWYLDTLSSKERSKRTASRLSWSKDCDMFVFVCSLLILIAESSLLLLLLLLGEPLWLWLWVWVAAGTARRWRREASKVEMLRSFLLLLFYLSPSLIIGPAVLSLPSLVAWIESRINWGYSELS